MSETSVNWPKKIPKENAEMFGKFAIFLSDINDI